MNDTPGDTDSAKLCAWCGEPVRQSGVGRSKDYCRRSCRQRAYEQRQVEKQLAAHRRLWEHTASDSSRDDRAIATRDETIPAGPPPLLVLGSLPTGPSQQKRRRLLPPPPGIQRAEAPAVDGE